MTDKRTIIINVAIEVAKAADHMNIATQLLKSTADRLLELDNEMRKPTLQVVNPIAEALTDGIKDE